MSVEIERVPWRRGDTPQHLGGQLGWHQAAKPTANQFWVFNGTTGLWAARALVDADLPSHGAAEHDNRTRVWPVDLAAGFQTAGTGTLNASVGLRITYVDAELGTWRWQIPIPGDLVTGTVTLCWQWDTAVTSGNVAWQVALGSTGAGVTHSAVNVLAATTVAAAVNGSTTLQTISTQASTSNVTAGRGDIAIFLSRLGGDAADTVAGGTDVFLRALWIEYTADM